MSVRFRILIPMVIISILAATTILFFNVVQFSAFVDNYIEEELDRAVFRITGEIEDIKMKSHTAVLYYASDNELVEAIERADQDAVLKRTAELFAQTDVGLLTIIDTNATVLARGHNPELYGDSAAHIPVVWWALEGNQALSAERGVSTNISVRASAQIYNRQGRLLGAIFAGDRLDTEEFVDKLKSFSGCEVTVFVDDIRVATTLYGDDGVRATNTSVPGFMERVLHAKDESLRPLTFQGGELVAKHTPVLDREGNIIGIVSVGKYLTEKQGMLMSFIMTGFLITVIFIVSSVLIILFVSLRIAAPINQSIDKALYDGLTGIFNRRFFEDRLNLLLKTLSRSGGIVSLMMIDIDFFKKYNDTYGHISGDDCLKTVATVLIQTVSRADDFVARYGGEEFVAVLPNTDETGACIVAEKLLENIRKCGIPHETNDVANHVTISIGVTTGRVNQTLNGADFIRQADLALYESKRNGRDMYTFRAMK